MIQEERLLSAASIQFLRQFNPADKFGLGPEANST
jgi:hypothetical protein